MVGWKDIYLVAKLVVVKELDAAALMVVKLGLQMVALKVDKMGQ